MSAGWYGFVGGDFCKTRLGLIRPAWIAQFFGKRLVLVKASEGSEDVFFGCRLDEITSSAGVLPLSNHAALHRRSSEHADRIGLSVLDRFNDFGSVLAREVEI